MVTRARWVAAALAAVCFVMCASAAEDAPTVEVFGGLSILSVDAVQGLGWQGSVNASLNRVLGAAADVAGHYKFHVSSYQFLFGPQFSKRGNRTTLFAHTLIGTAGAHSFGQSVNALALGLGGGADFRASDRLAVRLFQADWIPNRFEGAWEKRTGRVGFGLVLRLR